MGSVKTWLAAVAMLATAATSWASGAQNLFSTMDRGAQAPTKPNVTVRIASAHQGLTPQADNRLAVVLTHEPGWHTYWRMPGDAGLPTQFAFSVPADLKVTEPRFPLPERLATQDIVSFGYGDTAVFPFEVEVPRFPEGRAANLKVQGSFLACKDVCIPGEATAELRLPYAVAPAQTEDAQLIEAAQKSVPEISNINGLRAVYEDNRLKVTIPTNAVHIAKDLTFFPLQEYALTLVDGTRYSREEDGTVALSMTLSPNFKEAPTTTLPGVLVADGGPAKGGWAIETTLPLEKGTVPVPPAFTGDLPVPQTEVSVTTLTALLFAFLGGLILNLMPCVFPILSLKILQLVEGYRRGERLLPHGIAFTAGVLVTMCALSGILLALRGIGLALGWGFQLQSPWVVSLLIVLFVAITLNLFGIFEFTAATHLADSRAARNAPKSGVKSSFFTGMLAVIVASPCTAPFMGAALGYAVTQPAIEALAVFIALGFGMALPWLLLCIFPGWSRLLPKPGAWMDVFRKVMAIPMALAVVWLAWVLSKQISLNGMLLMLAASGATAVFLWLLGREQWGRGRNRALMGVTALVTASIIGVIATGIFDRDGDVSGHGHWQPWSDQAVTKALADGRPVFVDFTAAWCVTCQANKVAALNRDEVQAAFQKQNFVLLIGDWTNHDPAITEILAKFGRSGVPLYLVYRPDGTVDVLPELLTPSIVIDALEKH